MKLNEAIGYLQYGDWYNNLRFGISKKEQIKIRESIIEVCEALRAINEKDYILGRCEDCASCDKEHGLDDGPYEARLLPCKHFSCKEVRMTFYTHSDDFCSGFVPREEESL